MLFNAKRRPAVKTVPQSGQNREAGRTSPAAPAPSHEELAGIYDALSTTLGWRRAAARAADQRDGSLVGSNRSGAETIQSVDDRRPPSRPVEFGGLALQLVTEALDRLDPAGEIPSIVTDSMLRRIVEAHFAVWYVWHVPTGTIIAPGMQELLDIPHRAVPTIVEEWLGRVHPEDLPRMVAENDESLRTNSAFRSEYRFRRGDGSYISVSDWGIVLSGDEGDAEWMAGGLRDITIEKTLEQARGESAHCERSSSRRRSFRRFSSTAAACSSTRVSPLSTTSRQNVSRWWGGRPSRSFPPAWSKAQSARTCAKPRVETLSEPWKSSWRWLELGSGFWPRSCRSSLETSRWRSCSAPT